MIGKCCGSVLESVGFKGKAACVLTLTLNAGANAPATNRGNFDVAYDYVREELDVLLRKCVWDP